MLREMKVVFVLNTKTRTLVSITNNKLRADKFEIILQSVLR